MRIKREKVLITGGTGFVGANLCRRLLKDGWNVCIIRRKTSNKWRLSDIVSDLEDYTVDLLDKEKLERVLNKIKPAVIFHLATAGIYGGKHLPENELIETNIIGTFNLIDACKKIDYKCFVNTGSSSEYGPKNEAMKENNVCQPNTMYGITKLTATLYAAYTARSTNKPIVNFRLFSPYGPYDSSSRLISYVAINALGNKELHCFSPDNVRDYIYVEDVIDLYLKTIDKADTYKGEVFNVGTGIQTKISYVIRKIIKFTNSNSRVKWNYVKGRSYDTSSWRADIAKTIRCFKWRPRYSIANGLKETVAWFRDNLNLYKNEY